VTLRLRIGSRDLDAPELPQVVISRSDTAISNCLQGNGLEREMTSGGHNTSKHSALYRQLLIRHSEGNLSKTFRRIINLRRSLEELRPALSTQTILDGLTINQIHFCLNPSKVRLTKFNIETFAKVILTDPKTITLSSKFCGF
jgi:hypothetical protein